MVMNIIDALYQEVIVVNLVKVHHGLAEMTAHNLRIECILVVQNHAVLHW